MSLNKSEKYLHSLKEKILQSSDKNIQAPTEMTLREQNEFTEIQTFQGKVKQSIVCNIK